MRLLAALAAAGALLTGSALAVAGAPTGPAQWTENELQRAADRLVATSDIPAVITLVEQDGRLTVVAAGEAEIERRKARPNDRFWVGSVTKSFVATVVMQLVAEHKLRLDDRVSTLLPGRLRGGRRIRLRNLLNHTSGIPNYMEFDPWISAVSRNPRVVISPRRLISSVARLTLEFPPGSRASYSNTNYLVLAEILQRATCRRPAVAGSTGTPAALPALSRLPQAPETAAASSSSTGTGSAQPQFSDGRLPRRPALPLVREVRRWTDASP